jgi:hypothetical protein
MKVRTLLLLVLAVLLAGIVFASHSDKSATHEGSPYLFVWSGDAAHQSSDFLAVVDAKPSSRTYGRIVATLPVGASGIMPHHTEYEFPAGNVLFANGWVGGRTFLLDLNDPLHPRVQGQFLDRAGYTLAHSFVRLPNGHVLATFQSQGQGYAPGGGLVELDETGAAVRSASAVDSAVDKDLIWPYSLAVVPQDDRAVSTSTPMGWPDWARLPPNSWPLKRINDQTTAQLQVWQLSTLHLLKTVTLADAGGGKHNVFPAEPRLLPDGSVLVGTFSCGLFRVKDVQGSNPSAEMVYAFPGGDNAHTMCSVPVVVGHYWIQTVAALPGLIALDVSHPEKPVEVSRLRLDSHFMMPHWLAADRKSDRLVITGDDQSWALLAHFDAEKGVLSLDQTFREPGASQPGVSFDRQEWPHGKGGRALVHGALFGPR